MISKKVEKAINDQIKNLDALGAELKFVHYLNDRGGYSVLQDIEQPPFKFDTLQKMFQEVLKHEQFITASINELYHLCTTEKDYTTANFLQWFITEQLEEENLVNGILDTMALAGNDKSGLFHIDKELGAKAAPAGGGTASAT